MSRAAAVMRPLAIMVVFAATTAAAQTQEPSTRAEVIEQAQAEKATRVRPYEPGKAEKYLDRVEQVMTTGGLRLHPFFQSAYSGGGFTLGAGYRTAVSPYNSIDVRGSWTLKGYKRVESEFVAPRFLRRRANFSFLGGWREATQVGFYGLGNATVEEANVSYGFTQLYAHGVLEVKPTNRFFTLRGGLEASQWEQGPGSGPKPSVETVYTPPSLPGLGQTITYIQTHGMVGFDTRPVPGYARRGRLLGVTFRDFSDTDSRYGFKQVDYEAIQHIPLLRESWALSLHAAASVTGLKDGQEIPFFMMPSVGGGSSLRGYSSWRFRDRNSLLLQAEWRVMVNRFLDTALFYDMGKVEANTRDLDFSNLKDDYGIGFRFHTPLATPLRIEFARSREGMTIVFSSSGSF